LQLLQSNGFNLTHDILELPPDIVIVLHLIESCLFDGSRTSALPT
jgi:hypothetical protein